MHIKCSEKINPKIFKENIKLEQVKQKIFQTPILQLLKRHCFNCSRSFPQKINDFICPNEHMLCLECQNKYFQSVIDNIETMIPLKCSYCKMEISNDVSEIHFQNYLQNGY